MKKRGSIDATEGVIWRQLLLFFVPILLGSLFQQLYNMVDAMVVGRFIGKNALAAVDSTSSYLNLLINFFVGASGGISVVVSQYYGAHDDLQVSRSVHTGVALSLVGGTAIMALGVVLAPASMRVTNVPDDIWDMALTYLNVYFAGTIPLFIYNIGSGILRATGDSRRPLYYLVVACFANIVLDLLFVAVFKWGIVGAALATVVSQVLSAALVIAALIRAEDSYKLFVKRIKFHREVLLSVLKVGLPMGLQSAMYSVSNMIIRSAVNGFGTNIIAAWAVSGRMDFIIWTVMDTFGIAVTTFSAQNYGARKYERVKQSVRTCLYMGLGTVFALSAILFFIAPYFGTMFTTDREVIDIATYMLRFYAPYFMIFVFSDILGGAIRGTGETFKPMLITLIGTCLLRVVWVLAAVPVFGNIESVMWSYPLTWIITSGIFVVYYLRGVWFKKAIAKHSEL